MTYKRKAIIIIFIIGLMLSAGSFFVSADETKEEERAALEEELKELEREIARAQRDLTMTEAEKESLQHRINRLQGEINYLTSQIERNRLLVRNLGLQIEDRKTSITITTQKIQSSRDELSEMLRTIYTEGRVSNLEILLAEDDLSSFFNNLNLLERLSRESKVILDEVKELRSQLQQEKTVLEQDRTETERIARVQEEQKRQEELARKEQERLYGLTEAEYQRQLAEKTELEERKEEIEAKLLQLVGIPDVEMPTFGEALEVAKWVQNQTGIRPAFLLAIIMQESALGRNVGQCYIADNQSGASRHIRTGQYYSNGIHPTRDLPLFIEITRELGRDPMKTPVSCPMSYGYGGAMGPAQFIPSTWQGIRHTVTGRLGREPDPWRISDSFLASGTLLSQLGGVNNERTAALKYFAGGNWQASHVQFYGDQVVQRTNCVQVFIDHGTMSATCSNLIFIP